MPFVYLIEAHVNGLSKDLALVENLGSNQKGAMRILMDVARKKDAEKGIDHAKTEKILKRAQGMFDEFMGENSPQSEALANAGLTYRALKYCCNARWYNIIKRNRSSHDCQDCSCEWFSLA
jgi:hypothetical protein